MSRRSDLFSVLLGIFTRIFIAFILIHVASLSLDDLGTLYLYISTPRHITLDLVKTLQLIASSIILFIYIYSIISPKPASISAIIVLEILSSRYALEEILVVFLALFVVMIYDNIRNIYSKNQFRYIGFSGISRRGLVSRISLSIILLLSLVAVLVILPAAYIYGIYETMRASIKPANIYEAYVINFVTNNVVGEVILISALLSIFAFIIRELASIYVFFVSRSEKLLRRLFFEDLTDLDTGFEGPGRTLYTSMISLLIAPFVFSVINPLIRLYLGAALMSGEIYDALLAIASFVLSWILTKLFLDIFSEERSFGRRIISGVIVVSMIYLVSYYFYGWRPSENIFYMAPLDEFIRDTVYRYYSLIFYLIEVLGRVTGFAP